VVILTWKISFPLDGSAVSMCILPFEWTGSRLSHVLISPESCSIVIFILWVGVDRIERMVTETGRLMLHDLKLMSIALRSCHFNSDSNGSVSPMLPYWIESVDCSTPFTRDWHLSSGRETDWLCEDLGFNRLLSCSVIQKNLGACWRNRGFKVSQGRENLDRASKLEIFRCTHVRE